jgi:hypothetical protein
MGDSDKVTLDVTPGEYELQCDVVEEVDGQMVSHYVKGMHTTLRVE